MVYCTRKGNSRIIGASAVVNCEKGETSKHQNHSSLTDVLHLGGYQGTNRQVRNQIKKLLADRVIEYIDAAGQHPSVLHLGRCSVSWGLSWAV